MIIKSQLIIGFLFLISPLHLYAEPPESITIKFGINSTDSPKIIASKILPILRVIEMEAKTGHDKNLSILFRVFRTYDESIQAFIDGEIDFGRLGPASYVLAKRKQPELRLLAMENRKGSKRFNGLIIVHKDSPFKTLLDLKGKSFAFGNKVSTIGRYLAQRELAKAGICAKDLSLFKYLRRHDNVFTAVELNQFDAGALKESTFHKRNKSSGNVRILHSFPNVTKPWIARANLDPDLFDTLQSILLNLEDASALRNLKIEGFFPSQHEDYAMVEDAMFNSDEFFQCGDTILP